MTGIKKIWGVLAIVLALGVIVSGCDNGSANGSDTVYSYKVDEIAGGLFGNLCPAITMNEWCLIVLTPPMTYDSCASIYGTFLFKDEKLKTAFTGSDILDENTIIYCDFNFTGQGKKIGEITGTITLTNIPHPATTRVYLHNGFWNGIDTWWNYTRKIDMSTVSETTATLNWSLPVFESFKPNSGNSSFDLIILPGDSKKAYEIPVGIPTNIGNANENVGSLGTVSIKGVTLSGTINVTYNGEPVPYVEIFANYGPHGNLNNTSLSLPGPDTPWSVTFGTSTTKREIEFQVFGYSKKGDTVPIIDRYVKGKDGMNLIEYATDQSISGIALDLGNISYD